MADRSRARTRGGHTPRHEMVGLTSRRLAVGIVDDVLHKRKPVNDAFDASRGNPVLLLVNARDRAYTRNLAAVTLRHLGWLRQAVRTHMQKHLPRRAGTTEAILLVAAAQILCLGTADHAAVDQAVRLASEDRDARHFRGLVNGVLRSVIRSRDTGDIAQPDPAVTLPDWLSARWRARFGTTVYQAIAARLLEEPALDISIKHPGSVFDWAARTGGFELANGSVRLAHGSAGRPEQLEGYAEGAWWVQDAAARLPVLLLGDVAGRGVVDLAAAPGGKTAQLAAAGAQVTALDKSESRLGRLRDNLERLRLTAETHVADATVWQPAKLFDAVLLDAPCSATGTLRRHPDIAWIRRDTDITALADIQSRLLVNAATMVRPGGLLVYATCSLEPEEGPDQIRGFLATNPDFEWVRVEADEIGGLAEAITGDGAVQTRPDFDFSCDGACQPVESDADSLAHPGSGMDGFFIARLRRLR